MGLSGQEISAESIESCRQGDREALREIYEIYKDKVYSIAFYFFHGDAAMASDITQQVFLKLITHIQQFRGDSSFSTWLYRLVSNTCIDEARRRKGTAIPVGTEPREGAGNSRTPEDGVSQGQMVRLIQTAVAALPAPFRMAILLRYFEDLSYTEMAKALNCSTGTVSSRLSRGHRLLASRLGEFEDWFKKREP